jgi:hypothetical protein
MVSRSNKQRFLAKEISEGERVIIIWETILIMITSFGWLGSVIIALWPTVAVKLGLTEIGVKYG